MSRGLDKLAAKLRGRSDEELAEEIERLRSERRPLARSAGTFREDVHAQLDARLVEARELYVLNLARATRSGGGVPLEPVFASKGRSLFELAVLRTVAHDKAFEAELRQVIDETHPPQSISKAAFEKKLAAIDAEIADGETELRRRPIERRQDEAQAELERLAGETA